MEFTYFDLWIERINKLNVQIMFVYEDHPSFESPNDPNSKIWRYMDFIKFVSLLENQCLYFPRSDKLGDPYEGSITQINDDAEKKFFTEKFPNKDFKKILSKVRKSLRKHTYISCWHLSEFESVAMWNIYAKSNYGIAIQSDYNSFKKSFTTSEHTIYIGMVKYINYNIDFIHADNLFNPFLRKRRSFEYEKELRAIYSNPSSDSNNQLLLDKSGPKGISINIRVSDLIKNVYVSPNSPDWIFDLLSKVVKRYNYDIPLIKSQLDSRAIF